MNKNFNDLTGKTFGEWEVLEYVGNYKWKCRCSCGEERIKRGYDLTSGISKSCGHGKNKFIDLTGKQFNEFTVIKYLKEKRLWLCQCSCGEIREIRAYDLTRGLRKSCGHLQIEDYTGRQFGEWTVLGYAGNGRWTCRCSCGTERKVPTSHLRDGNSKSCGHTKLVDLTGMKFGNWEVLKYLGNSKWLCRCSCGNEVEVLGSNLRNGTSTSCGCLAQEKFKKSMINKYGTTSYAKFDTARSKEQLEAVENAENFISTILESFDHTPNTHELSQLLGINETNVLKTIHKFGAESYVELGINRTSSYEKQIIEKFGGEQSNRSILEGKEIDIYYPENKVGIEINGDYWHSELHKDKLYHQEKTINCIKRGVRLIHLFQYELDDINKRDKIEKYLDTLINKEDNRVIYARNCEIKEISRSTRREFLDKYHLQGTASSVVNIGIFYKSELVGVMTFGKPRFNSEYEYELIRMAFVSKTIVVGGANKMFKWFIRKYNPSSILTYCDIAKFSGDSYIKMGFKPLHVTEPNYIWFNTSSGKVLTRYKTMKHKLIQDGLGNTDMTEDEIMHSLGYVKIFDCGNLKLEWRANNG